MCQTNLAKEIHFMKTQRNKLSFLKENMKCFAQITAWVYIVGFGFVLFLAMIGVFDIDGMLKQLKHPLLVLLLPLYSLSPFLIYILIFSIVQEIKWRKCR